MFTRFLFLSLSAAFPLASAAYETDFAKQPVTARPSLEVRFTDGTRSAFEIDAAQYRFVGELRKPHRLVDSATRAEAPG